MCTAFQYKSALQHVLDCVEAEADTYEGCNELTDAGCFERLDLLQTPVIGMEDCRPLRYLPDVLAFGDQYRMWFADVYYGVTPEVAAGVSAAAVKELGGDPEAWTYGEIDFFAFASLMDKVVQLLPDGDDTPKGAFVDLGSGSGKAVLACALTQAAWFTESRGVEMIGGLHTMACAAAEKLVEHLGDDCPVTKFREGDLRDEDLSDVTVAFCHSTMFDKSLLDALATMAQPMAKGSIVITSSYALEGPGFEQVAVVESDMSWGSGTMYVQRTV